ncbi:MAG: ImmA/IrrE family metallo-endopeptidase, partial [Campylobacter sp.]|nr:ImmA/IrrE family metallo-endopeptidase [Campylobacter sp.]
FINKNDTYKAQIFTLFHEIAHLWIRESGISDIKNMEIDNNIERFCNKIAAEVLMPKEVFVNKFDKLNDDWLLNLEEEFCVSKLAILTRAKVLNLISNNEYKQYRDIELENIRANLQNRRLRKDFNIPHEVVIQSKYGRLFSKAVVGAVLSEKETYRSGAKLFGETKTSIIDKLAKL